MTSEFVHSLDEVVIATGSANEGEGRFIDMYRLTLEFHRQDEAGHHPVEALPEIWMEPHEVASMIQGLRTALHRHFPETAAKLDAEMLASQPQREPLS